MLRLTTSRREPTRPRLRVSPIYLITENELICAVKENVEGVADEAHAAKESVKQDLGATVDDLSNRIDSTFDTETHKPEAGDDADDDKDVHAPGGDHDDSLNADEGRPRTPLGGHDPTAPEAFSYAQAVKD